MSTMFLDVHKFETYDIKQGIHVYGGTSEQYKK